MADSQHAAVVPASAPVVSAPAPASQLVIVNAVDAITWTDPATGHSLALTGRMPEARLQQIKISIERERAAAAAKKKPCPAASALRRRALKRHPHRVVSLVHVDDGAGDSGSEGTREKRGGIPDFFRLQWLGEGRITGAVLNHLLDDSYRACRARRQWTR